METNIKNLAINDLHIDQIGMKLTSGDPSFLEDVKQEMKIAIIEAPGGMTKSWYVARGKYKGRQYLRKERLIRKREVPSGLLNFDEKLTKKFKSGQRPAS